MPTPGPCASLIPWPMCGLRRGRTRGWWSCPSDRRCGSACSRSRRSCSSGRRRPTAGTSPRSTWRCRSAGPASTASPARREHATYRNVQAHPQFTVSFPQPDQVLTSSFAAGGRTEGDVKPTLAAVPTAPARVVDGQSRPGLPALPRVRARADRRRFRPEQPHRRPGRRRVRCSRGAARRRGGRRRPRASPRAARLPRPRSLRRRARQPRRSRTPSTSGASPMAGQPRRARCSTGCDEHRREMVDLLERLARAESPTLDAGDPARAVPDPRRRARAGRASSSGAVRGRGSGDHLYARPGQRRRGEPAPAPDRSHGHRLARRHARRDAAPRGGRAALRPGRRRHEGRSRRRSCSRCAPCTSSGSGRRCTPVVFVNTDEEIGQPRLEPLHPAARARRRPAFVLESGEGADGELKIARKGLGRFTVTVHGRSVARRRRLRAGDQRDPRALPSGAAAVRAQRPRPRDHRQRRHDRRRPAAERRRPAGERDRRRARAHRGRGPPAGAAPCRGLTPVLEGATLEVEGGWGRPPMEALPRNRDPARDREAARPRARPVARGRGPRRRRLRREHDEPLHGHPGRPRPGRRGLARERRARRHAADARAHRPARPAPPRAGCPAAGHPHGAGASRSRVRRARRRRGSPCAARTRARRTRSSCRRGARSGSTRRSSGPARPTAGCGRAIRCWAGSTSCPTLDGVESGLLELLWLERRGVRVLNPASALVAAHDKLVTARLLARAGVPHPRTEHLRPGRELPDLGLPLVIKPRLGSWGVDVFRCASHEELRRALEEVRSKPWFLRHGALVQELVPPVGYDLRLVVAGGVVVGAIRRVAAPHEWRTNASLGGTRRQGAPVGAACRARHRRRGGDRRRSRRRRSPAGRRRVHGDRAQRRRRLRRPLLAGGQDVLREAAVALGLLRGGSQSCRERDDFHSAA